MERSFVWEYDKQYRVSAWRPEDQPTFNSGSGITVAHDMMEHADYSDTSIEGEMMAFGAGLFVRYEGGYWPRHVVYADVATSTTCEFLDERKFVIKEAPPVDELPEHIERELSRLRYRVEANFHMAATLGWRDIKPELTEPAVERAFGWMRHGYVKAVERYAGHSAKAVLKLYKKIESEIDDKIGQRRDGDRLIVSFSPKTLRHKIELVSAEELLTA